MLNATTVFHESLIFLHDRSPSSAGHSSTPNTPTHIDYHLDAAGVWDFIDASLLDPSCETAAVKSIVVIPCGGTPEILQWVLIVPLDGEPEAAVGLIMEPPKDGARGTLHAITFHKGEERTAPNADETKGRLGLTLKTLDVHRGVELRVTTNVPRTVNELIAFMHGRQLDDYTFAEDGHGSRHWVTEVVHRLEADAEDGWLEEGSLKALLAFYEKYGEENPGMMVVPTREGSFGQTRWLEG